MSPPRSPRRRRHHFRRQRSRSPCPRRRRRRLTPCCRLSHRLCPRNRHPGTLFRIKSFICSWPLTGGTNPRHRFSVEEQYDKVASRIAIEEISRSKSAESKSGFPSILLFLRSVKRRASNCR